MNFELSSLSVAFEVAAGQNFKTANDLYAANELAFELQTVGGDPSLYVRVNSDYEEIGCFDFACETAVDFYREIVTQLS
jgi:hypothetical protein